MIDTNALVIYKNKPALVKEKSDGKFSISLSDGEQLKVRDKDIELIHPGPVKDFSGISAAGASSSAVREVWELLSDDADSSYSLKDLAALVFGEYTPSSAYAAFCLLQDGLFFSGSIAEVKPRLKEEVAADEAKRGEKQRDLTERVSFLERLKACLKKPAENTMLGDDMRFMQDVEALAYGKSAKSRTMKELGLGETPEDAHAVLLATGFWTAMVNPHPSRFGLSLVGANICPPAPSFDNRSDLCHLEAFAIDSPWSSDPDDAVSIEAAGDKTVLYVHIADPASAVDADSPAEKEARDRGSTLYLPEATVRMLADDSLPLFALGLSEKSPALTFKITLNENSEIINTEIIPSVVKVRRITYEEADKEIDNLPSLRALFDLAQRNLKRRTAMGAINIELPEIHITMKDGIVDIEPLPSYRSAVLVRECMVIAGEGAGSWASSKGLAFPYISQEVELQGSVPGGLAGSYQLRRCMRPRVLSTKPGRHQGLGLDTYTQVTSPLRRYTDLLSHIQIRAVLRGDKPLSSDEVSARLGFSEAGAVAAVQAERASNAHWIMTYLSDKKDSVWDAVALEKKGNRWALVIPALALETQVSLQRDVSPNDEVKLILKSVNIPKGEAVFIHNSSSE
jgi:exoribonuclease-2